MQNFGRENFHDSTCIRQISSDFSTVEVLRYTVNIFSVGLLHDETMGRMPIGFL